MADKVDFTINSNMHSAFLREVDRLQKAVATVDLSDSAVAAGLARRYVFFSHTLHAHHEGEDTFLWPLALAKATPQEAVILYAMAAEHEALATALTGLDSQFAQLSADSDVARISGGLDRLRAILTGHCAHEERDAVPVVQKYVTREDLKSFMAFTREQPDSTLVLAWVCDGATPAQIDSTWAMLPGFVRVFVKPMSTRKYAKFTAECGV